jgi:hypothetical protein
MTSRQLSLAGCEYRFADLNICRPGCRTIHDPTRALVTRAMTDLASGWVDATGEFILARW